MRSKFTVGILAPIVIIALLCGSASASFMDIFGGKGLKGSGQMESRGSKDFRSWQCQSIC